LAAPLTQARRIVVKWLGAAGGRPKPACQPHWLETLIEDLLRLRKRASV